jgi:hypothetical protein
MARLLQALQNIRLPLVSFLKHQPLNMTGLSDIESIFACSAPATKDNFREIQVKVHVRQTDKDSWLYLGRGVVTQELYGQSSRVGEFKTPALLGNVLISFFSVVVRHLGNGKPITTFSEVSLHPCAYRCRELSSSKY